MLNFIAAIFLVYSIPLGPFSIDSDAILRNPYRIYERTLLWGMYNRGRYLMVLSYFDVSLFNFSRDLSRNCVRVC